MARVIQNTHNSLIFCYAFDYASYIKANRLAWGVYSSHATLKSAKTELLLDFTNQISNPRLFDIKSIKAYYTVHRLGVKKRYWFMKIRIY